ncbi:apolipoprotein N-acyltransferase [Chlamydiifrater phoenicopteri]|uniref:apolipoprotein N-acyltransferase n=1 Tax=Chlamydiifrater phoenicopteri TaxID=2681469 RepID=UPI001BCF417E|nr:apolipoprotein N-acyltransferase [Chlamydiifrater phoenicopteri]
MLSVFWLFLSLFSAMISQPDIAPCLSLVGGVSSFGLFWYSIRTCGTKKRGIIAFFWMAVVSAVHFSWMTSVSLLGWAIYFPWIALAMLSGLVFSVFSLGLFWTKKYRSFLSTTFIFSFLWVFWEAARHYYILSGISLDYVGWALTGAPYFAQFSSFFGWAGLSVVVMSANIALFYFLERRRLQDFVSLFFLVFLPCCLGGGLREIVKHREGASVSKSLRVALLQTAEPPFTSIPSRVLSVWEKLFKLCSRIDSKVDLIVMPEVSVPFGVHRRIYPAEEYKALQEMWLEGRGSFYEEPFLSNKEIASDLSNRFNCDLLLGLERYTDSERRFYNSAFMFSPGAVLSGSYDKRILVPGGEYIPGGAFGERFFRLFCPECILPYVREPGTKSGVFISKDGIPLAVTICYEETFGFLVREYKKAGARLLINISNDGWYPGSRLPKVHFLHGVLRNLECGLPCVRACHTGVTAVVDALGRVIAKLPEDNCTRKVLPGVLIAEVPLFEYCTPYSIYGDWPIKIASWIAVIIFLWWCFQPRKRE